MTQLAQHRAALSEPTPHGWASGGLLSAAIHAGGALLILNLVWSQVGDSAAPSRALVIEIVSAANATPTQAAHPTLPSPIEPAVDQSEPVPQVAPAEPLPPEPIKELAPPAPRADEPVPQKLATPQPVPPQPATLTPPPKPTPVAKPHPVKQAQTKPAPVAPTSQSDVPNVTGPQATRDDQLARLPPGDGDIPIVTVARFRSPPTPAAYPRRSVELSEEGTVMIRALVDASGLARDVRIWRTSGHPRLDEAARSAVRQWQFEPARQAGRPITAWVEIPVNFRLQ